jgi:hypothetical protein
MPAPSAKHNKYSTFFLGKQKTTTITTLSHYNRELFMQITHTIYFFFTEDLFASVVLTRDRLNNQMTGKNL